MYGLRGKAPIIKQSRTIQLLYAVIQNVSTTALVGRLQQRGLLWGGVYSTSRASHEGELASTFATAGHCQRQHAARHGRPATMPSRDGNISW